MSYETKFNENNDDKVVSTSQKFYLQMLVFQRAFPSNEFTCSRALSAYNFQKSSKSNLTI